MTGPANSSTTPNRPPAEPLKHRLELLLLRLLVFPLRRLPRKAALSLGRGLGQLAFYLQPGRVRISLDNLRQAFPDQPLAAHRDLTRQLFRHFGCCLVDLVRLDTLDPQRDLERLYSFEGMEHLHRALELNRGALILTGHVGFWESGTFFLPLLGIPVDFIAKPMKNRLADAYITALRTHWGGGVINSRQGARRIVRSLQQNRTVCVLLDQRVSKANGVPVSFFGRTAYATPIITQIAKKHGVPIVPVFCYRTADDRFQVTAGEAILLDDDTSPEEVAADTQRLTTILEQAIAREKSQWFWFHRRWRG